MLPLPFQSNHRPLQSTHGPVIKVKNPSFKNVPLWETFSFQVICFQWDPWVLSKKQYPISLASFLLSLPILLPNPSRFSSSSVFSISQLFTFLTSQNTDCQNNNHKLSKVSLLFRVPEVTANSWWTMLDLLLFFHTPSVPILCTP